ncbi:hypothetical protein QBC38DRAFT_370112, partial [Podospora fimiseda]
SFIGLSLSNLITLPYYRFYRENTLFPVLTIAQCVRDRQSPEIISAKISNWRERKLSEYQFITVASTLLSAAVIGCFSWAPRDTEHWLGPGSWYASLVLSMTSVLLASSQAFIFSAIKGTSSESRGDRLSLSRELEMILRVRGVHDDYEGIWNGSDERRVVDESLSLGDRDNLNKGGKLRMMKPTDRRTATIEESDEITVEVRWNMIFTWQAPMMLMAYSITAFIIGLTVYITTPLYDGGRQAAIVYLVACGLAGLVFVWCSFWAYKFVDLQGRDEVEITAKISKSEKKRGQGQDVMIHRRVWFGRDREGEEA